MPTLTPSGGKTNCDIYVSGAYPSKFSNTYDGRTNTGCFFYPRKSCSCEWYWDSPVNITAFNIYTLNFQPCLSHIDIIYGRVDGTWTEIWRGTWLPKDHGWNSKAVSCNNCTGIKIAVVMPDCHLPPGILEVSISYTAPPPPPPEGKARITSFTAPPEFTPNVVFSIYTILINDGGDDTLFFRLINRDTGKILVDVVNSVITKTGKTWSMHNKITLTQTTDFHGKIEAGHIE